MIKCPFCHFDNEDGALFCDQCKSDLSSVASTPPPVMPALPAIPVMAEPVPIEPIAVEPLVIEAVPVEAVPVMAEPAIPVLGLDSAEPVVAEAMPILAEAVPVEVEAVPVLAEPVPVPVAAEPVPATPVILEPVQPVPVPAPVVPAVPVQAVPAPAPAPAAPAGGGIPAGAQPRLLVMRGVKRNAEYEIFEGPNFVGRSDDKPVDIDLEEQEPPDRVWCSRQHCCIFFEGGELSIEDLNSSNGTFVNRTRIYPGQKKILSVGDIVQIGNVQMKVVV